MDIAVIGGSRHIGPFIVSQLVEQGHRVSVYNRGRTAVELPDGVKQVVVDRKQPDQLGTALREHRPDAIIDMIGFVVADLEQVVAALPDLGHYVFCSSAAVYGVIEDRTPSEAEEPSGDYPYAIEKANCDAYLLEQHRRNGFAFTSLRLAHPYGPGDHMLYTTGRESLFLDRMRKQRPIIVPGDGISRTHPIYVEDAARAFTYVLDRPECIGRIYNLAGDEILSTDAYFASIARVLGVPPVVRKIPHGWFKEHASLWADWRRKFDFGYNWVHYQSAFDVTALRETGFRCRTDHDAGTALMMDWLDAKGLIDPSGDADEEERILEAL